ncbi:MAG: peptidase T [Cytophagaceae bacterium]|nr:peptidase T [Cytophagaceae bacterium]MBL0324398.1 peptidase T [Cytophagaceae bacterium]
MKNLKESLTERFLKYVQIDTQSDQFSETYPSTNKQFDLAKVLIRELQDLGVNEVELDEYCYIYATIKGNSEKKNIPKIMFCSHMDTAPDCSGTGVKPIIHENYKGNDIVLPDDPTQIIKPGEHPDLKDQIGNDIITASGTTLLGADNKAGLAAIMTAVEFLIKNPEIKHGDIKILFTPDEEIGRGTDKVDLKKLGADFGYTIDGETLGSLENETFSADGVEITIHGVSAHPGFGKNKLVNAIKIACEIIAELPKDSLSPETTEGKEGFIHPTDLKGGQETCSLHFIIRDFDEKGLLEKEDFLKNITEKVLKKYPEAKMDFVVKQQYRNMKVILDQYPDVTENALEAIKRSGLNPKLQSIRGGTDGSRLSFMGLPCPNIFAGEHAFHSKLEWVSVQDMLKAAEVIVNICKIYEEKA